MVRRATVAIGVTSGCVFLRIVTPSATQLGGKKLERNDLISTFLPNFCPSPATTFACVNGHCVQTTMSPVAIRPTNTPSTISIQRFKFPPNQLAHKFGPDAAAWMHQNIKRTSSTLQKCTLLTNSRHTATETRFVYHRGCETHSEMADGLDPCFPRPDRRGRSLALSTSR